MAIIPAAVEEMIRRYGPSNKGLLVPSPGAAESGGQATECRTFSQGKR